MERTPVKSSLVKSIGYLDKKMEIEFKNGSIYSYEPVGPTIFDAFLEAPSKGKYFHTYIKGNFQATKVQSIRILDDLGPAKEINMDGVSHDFNSVNKHELKELAKEYLKKYTSETDTRHECCRQTVKAFIKYFFNV